MEGPIIEAHRALDARFDSLREVLRTGTAEAAAAPFGALVEELDAHFEQEDALYYPSIGALRRETQAAIRAIAQAHDRFREQLAAIRGHLERGEGAEAARRFDEFLQEFSRHEREEEALVRSVQAAAALA